jgi:hypothetical protein
MVPGDSRSYAEEYAAMSEEQKTRIHDMLVEHLRVMKEMTSGVTGSSASPAAPTSMAIGTNTLPEMKGDDAMAPSNTTGENLVAAPCPQTYLEALVSPPTEIQEDDSMEDSTAAETVVAVPDAQHHHEDKPLRRGTTMTTGCNFSKSEPDYTATADPPQRRPSPKPRTPTSATPASTSSSRPFPTRRPSECAACSLWPGPATHSPRSSSSPTSVACASPSCRVN